MLPAIVPACREVSGSCNSWAETFEEIPGSHHPGFQNSKESTFWELYCSKKSGQSLPFVVLDAQGIFLSTSWERQEAWSSLTDGKLSSLNTNHGSINWTSGLVALPKSSRDVFCDVSQWGNQGSKQLAPWDQNCSNGPCPVLHKHLNSLGPAQRIGQHPPTWRLKASIWKLHSKWTRTCWPPRTERLKTEF